MPERGTSAPGPRRAVHREAPPPPGDAGSQDGPQGSPGRLPTAALNRQEAVSREAGQTQRPPGRPSPSCSPVSPGGQGQTAGTQRPRSSSHPGAQGRPWAGVGESASAQGGPRVPAHTRRPCPCRHLTLVPVPPLPPLRSPAGAKGHWWWARGAAQPLGESSQTGPWALSLLAFGPLPGPSGGPVPLDRSCGAMQTLVWRVVT